MDVGVPRTVRILGSSIKAELSRALLALHAANKKNNRTIDRLNIKNMPFLEL